MKWDEEKVGEGGGGGMRGCSVKYIMTSLVPGPSPSPVFDMQILRGRPGDCRLYCLRTPQIMKLRATFELTKTIMNGKVKELICHTKQT